MKPWHNDDRFWKTWGPILFTRERCENAEKEIEQLLKLVKIKPDARVLDVCCGVGRHSLALAKHGFRVTGVDRTKAYIRKARASAKRAKSDAKFIVADARRFRRANAFELAINLFTSIGYSSERDDRRILTNICRSLRPGGVLVLDVSSKEILARNFRERDWREVNGALVLEERKLMPGWSGIDNRWILIQGGRRQDFKLSLRIYSAVELATLLRECGFKRVRTLGGFDGAPYDHNARRLVLLARKGT